MAHRPFIIEALLVEPPKEKWNDDEDAENIEALVDCCVVDLAARHSWLDNNRRIVRRVHPGVPLRHAGQVRLRLLVEAGRALEEIARNTGENLIVRRPVGEVFVGLNQTYYVTAVTLTEIEGSFSHEFLTRRDGEEVGESLGFFMMPDVLMAVEQRVEALMQIADFAIEHSDAIDAIAAPQLSHLDFAKLDHVDLDDIAVGITQKLRYAEKREVGK